MTSITRFAAVVTLALASGSALMALGQLPTIQEVSYYAPASFAELCSTSDLVARVRIDRSSVNALALSGLEKKNPKTVLTEFIVTVQDVIFSKTAAPAGPIRIFQHAGEADVDGRKIRVADESFPALQGSSSWRTAVA